MNTSGAVKFLLGSLIGAVTGMLVAPQSGEKTRQMLRNRSEQLQDQLQDQLSQAAAETQSKAKHLTQKARGRMREMSSRDISGPSRITPALVSGLLVGAMAGAMAGLLFAPQRGQKTREMLKEKGLELKDQVSHAVSNVASQVEQLGQEHSPQSQGG